MAAAENKAMVRRVIEEGMNQGNFNVFDELLDANYVNYDFPAPAPGSEGFKQVIGMFLAGFPDMRVTVEESVGEEDKVSTRGYFTGTHNGEFMSIPPTGKPIRVSYIDIWRVREAKLAENWIQMNRLSMMRQLGVIPQPEQANA